MKAANIRQLGSSSSVDRERTQGSAIQQEAKAAGDTGVELFQVTTACHRWHRCHTLHERRTRCQWKKTRGALSYGGAREGRIL